MGHFCRNHENSFMGVIRILIEFFVRTKKSNQDLRKKLRVIEYFLKECRYTDPKGFINENLKLIKSKEKSIEYNLGEHRESVMVETQLEKYLSAWYNATFAQKENEENKENKEKIMFDPLTKTYDGIQ